MTTVYVNTNSVGGDGTTNATSGATAAYSSLRQAILGEAADITGSGDLEILCDGGLDDEFITASDWTGWTTTTNDRVVVKTNPANINAPLTLDRTKYHFGEVGAWSAQGLTTTLLDVTGVHAAFSLQFLRDVSGYNSGTARRILYQGGSTHLELSNCIFDIRGYSNAGTGITSCMEVNTSVGSGVSLNVENSVFIGDPLSNAVTGGLRKAASAGNNLSVYNNLFIDIDNPIENASNNRCANNIFQGTTTEFSDSTPAASVRYNLTDNASINSSGTGDLVSKTLVFAGVDDFNLLDNTSGDNADVLAAGIGPSADADVPVLDAHGNTRTGATSDLLPYEFALANGPSTETATTGDIPLTIQAGYTKTDLVDPITTNASLLFGAAGTPVTTDDLEHKVTSALDSGVTLGVAANGVWTITEAVDGDWVTDITVSRRVVQADGTIGTEAVLTFSADTGLVTVTGMVEPLVSNMVSTLVN